MTGAKELPNESKDAEQVSGHAASARLYEEVDSASANAAGGSSSDRKGEKSSPQKEPGDSAVLELKDLFSKNEGKEAALKINQSRPQERELILGDFKNLFSQARSSREMAVPVENSATLPVPNSAEDILRRYGLGNPSTTGDSGLAEKTEKIVQNYENISERGQEVLRRVMANVEMLNTLPAYDRARLLRWNELPEDQKEAMGWIKEPPAELKEKLNWDNLTEQDRENHRWQAVRLQGREVLGQMYNGELQNGSNANLLKDLTGQVEAMRQGRQKEVEYQANVLTDLRKQRADALSELDATTREGVSFGRKVFNVFNNGRDESFNQLQTEQLRRLAELDSKINEESKKLASADLRQNQLALAKDVGEYQRFVNSGNQSDADKLAIKLWQQHGPSIAALAPGLWRDLTSNENGNGILKRMHDSGLAQLESVPSYAGGERNNPQQSELGFRQALGLENADAADKPVGLMQLKPGSNLIDTEAARAHMLGRIDSDPTLSKFSSQARDISGSLNDLSRMFSAAQTGTIYENFITNAKEKAASVKEMMDKVTPADLHALEGRIGTMSEALQRMKAQGAEANAEAVKELEDRVNSFKSMHNMLNKFDETAKYPEVIQGDASKTPNKDMRQIVGMILDNALQPSTLTSWLKQNGIVIAASIGAAAATVAAIGTFGAASPLAAVAYTGLAIAVSGLAAREITTEALYQINKNGYTGFGHYGEGSRIGNWGRASLDRTAVENLKALGVDVLAPYTVEIARDWAAFMVTAGLVGHFTQAGNATMKESFAALFKVPPANMQQLAFQAERAAAMQAGNGPSASFMRQFMGSFQKELLVNSGFSAAQISGETVIHEALGKELVGKMGHWGQFGLSFGISTAIALGQGWRHGRSAALLRDANMKPGNIMEFKLADGAREKDFIDHMRRQGFEVNQTKPGQWEVRPFGAPADFAAMTMENVSGRGRGTPNLDAVPSGTKPEMRPHEGDSSANPHVAAVREVGDSIVAGRYHEAVARSKQGLADGPNLAVNERDLFFDLAAYKKNPDAYMQSYLSKMADKGEFASSGKSGIPEVTLPVPQVSTPNGRVNLVNGEVQLKTESKPIQINPNTGEAVLAPGQRKTAAHSSAEELFKSVRKELNPAHFQRIALEQAIIQTEERLHLRQNQSGEAPVSTRYEQFLHDMTETATDSSGKRTQASKEQEIVLALHEAGWPTSLIEHHYGGQFHAGERRSALDYLRARDAVNNISDSTYKDFLNEAISNAPPAVRREMFGKLPELLAKPEMLGDVVTALDLIASNSGKDFYSIQNAITQISENYRGVLEDPAMLAVISKAIENVDMSLASGQDRARIAEDVKGQIERLGLSSEATARLSDSVTRLLKRAEAMESQVLAPSLRAEQQAVIDKIARDRFLFRNRSIKPHEFEDLVKSYGLSTRARDGHHNSDIVDTSGEIVGMYSVKHGGTIEVKPYNVRNMLDAIQELVLAGQYRPNRWPK